MLPTQADRVRFTKLHAAQKGLYQSMGPRNSGYRGTWRCGRRMGKTTLLEVTGGYDALKWGGAVGWFSPNYKLLLPSFRRMLRTLRPAVSHSSKVDSMIELEETGGHIEFWTLNDEDAGRSRAYDLVIIDEAGLMKKGLRDTWEQAIAPTLLDRNGNAIMAGTPKGVDPDNYFYEACTNKSLGWQESHLPTSANPTLDAVAIAKLKDEYPPLVYQQEFLADFVDWSGAAFFGLDKLLIDNVAGIGAPIPIVSDAVFATIDTAVKDRKEHDGTAVCYWAITKHCGLPYKLILLDWDIIQIEGSLLESWLPNVFANLELLAAHATARMGSIGAFIEDKASGQILLQQARRRGLHAHAIESDLTAKGKDERGISVSGYVHRSEVKLSQAAYDKVVNYKGQTRNHLVSQVCGYRIGQKDGADDLYDAFVYGVAIALGDAEGH